MAIGAPKRAWCPLRGMVGQSRRVANCGGLIRDGRCDILDIRRHVATILADRPSRVRRTRQSARGRLRYLSVDGGRRRTGDRARERVCHQTTGAAYFAIAENGTLVYYASPPLPIGVTLALVDTAGQAAADRRARIRSISSLVCHVTVDGWRTRPTNLTDPDVVVLEIEGRTAPSRFTFGGMSRYPVWSADGSANHLPVEPRRRRRTLLASERRKDSRRALDDAGERARATFPTACRMMATG